MIPRFQILKRDRFRCVYCGASGREVKLEIDHMHPRSKGGSDHPRNLVTSCKQCNAGKRDDEPYWEPCTPPNSYEHDGTDGMYLLDLSYQRACFADDMPAWLPGPDGVGGESCL